MIEIKKVWHNPALRRLLLPVVLIILVLLAGTLGYTLLEGWPLLDALYMTIITLTTVGFGEVRELDTVGTVFTMFLILGGVFSVTILISSMVHLIVVGEFQRILWRQKMDKSIEKLKDHIILCGHGNVGKETRRSFEHSKTPYVVIEKEEQIVTDLLQQEIPVIHGDATVEDTLHRAGIGKARGLVTTLENDADNVYVCLTARSISPHLMIVARATDERAITNLKQAGANRIISPTLIGGHQIAQAILRPAVLEFIHLTTRRGMLDLNMEELLLKSPCDLIGKQLSNSNLRSQYRVIVVAIQKPSGEMIFNPEPGYSMTENDTLIVLGPVSSLQELKERLT